MSRVCSSPPAGYRLSLYVPIVIRVLSPAIVVPPRRFFKEFDIPRSVRQELSFVAPDYSPGVA